MTRPLHVEKLDSTCLLKLNRPESRNAINRELLSELARVLRELPSWVRDEGIGALVVTSEGEAFCAGADLKCAFRTNVNT